MMTTALLTSQVLNLLLAGYAVHQRKTAIHIASHKKKKGKK